MAPIEYLPIRSHLSQRRGGASPRLSFLTVALALLGAWPRPAAAQQPMPAPGALNLPPSSIPGAKDTGIRAHTNLILLGPGLTPTVGAEAGPPFGPGVFYETPASMACLYGFQPAVAGCNPYHAVLNPTGGSRAVAIVDAYDNPNISKDMAVFTAQFGVAPAVNFNVVYAPSGGATPGSCSGAATPPSPAAGTGWDIEASLDTQWAHAMAPNAALYLVEAQSADYLDLLCAVSVASSIVVGSGGGEISMSWGGGEFPAEVSADGVFTAPGVVYFASAGDGPGVSYPSASPNVVSVGGTTLSRNALSGNFRFENTWQSTGGGASIFEPRPVYQNSIVALVGGARGVPDVSADANPVTGVWLFNSSYAPPTACPNGCWFVVGGTSLSSPLWAGITNAAGAFSASSGAELNKLYASPAGDFNDISIGVCGVFMGEVAAGGWDFCSGRGSPKTYTGK